MFFKAYEVFIGIVSTLSYRVRTRLSNPCKPCVLSQSQAEDLEVKHCKRQSASLVT